jgi:hypothetical protein
MWKGIKNKVKNLSKRRNDIVLVMLWAALMAFTVIKTYWVSYNTRGRLIYIKPAYPGYDLSGCDPLDLFLVAVAGIVAGIFLSEVKEMVFGYVVAILSAFMISVMYVSLYVWYVLDLGPMFNALAYGWEWVVFIAASIVFALMFPWIMCICLVGLAVGVFLRTWIGWS